MANSPTAISVANTSAASDLIVAARTIELASAIVGKGVRTLAATGGPDKQQVLAYDLAHAGAAVETARSMLDYGGKGEPKSWAISATNAHVSVASSSPLPP